jgi:hypothetical protein
MSKKDSNSNPVHKLFIKSMNAIAKEIGHDPCEIDKATFTANDPNQIPEWSLRKSGGFTGLKKIYFPESIADKDFKAFSAARSISSHKNKLEKQYGEELFKTEELVKAVQRVWEKNPPKLYPAAKPSKHKKSEIERVIWAQVSDTHMGANIDDKEMGGVNEFNWEIASRRFSLFAKQIASYKSQYREKTRLVLAINGDIIAGMIHNQEFFADLYAVQHTGAVHVLGGMISYLAQHFDSVEVHCTSGNHGRSMHKSSKERATTHKWDSYESTIYTALRYAFRDYKNISINVPVTPYAIYNVLGHWFFQTHGDGVINVGNPGKVIDMKGIDNQINKINASEIGGTQTKFSVVAVGHVHIPTIQLMDNGCTLLVNGTLSGADPFCQAISIFSNNPTQLICEVTKAHAVGDMRMVQLRAADNDKSLDSIISPYKGQLG